MYKFEFILLSLKILILIFLTLNFQKITTLLKEKLLYYISTCLFLVTRSMIIYSQKKNSTGPIMTMIPHFPKVDKTFLPITIFFPSA